MLKKVRHLQFVLKAKLVNKLGVIVGYRLVDRDNKIHDVSLKTALANSNKIYNVKISKGYLKCLDNTTGKLPKIEIGGEFKDYSDCKIEPIMLGGITNKVLISDNNGVKYIVKTGKEDIWNNTYFKDYISEFISCNIAKKLGYSVQEVTLGYFKGHECALLKYFGSELTTFKGLGYSTLEDEVLSHRDIRYNLDWLLKLNVREDKFKITQRQYKIWVWKVFFLDMFVSNYDRHENNWGFLKEDGKYTTAPLFDMGASLCIRDIDKVSNWSDGKIKNEILMQSRSAILYKNKKKNYFELLDIFSTNASMKRLLIEFINNVSAKIDEFDSIYADVIAFNSAYTDYVTFVNKLLRMKLKLLKVRYLK